MGTGGEVVGDRLAHRRQHRQLAGFAALAGDRQAVAGRRLGAADAERFRQAQPAAVDQRHEGGVTAALPALRGQLAGGGDRSERVVDGQRLGHRGRQFRRAQGRECCGRGEAAPLQEPNKVAQDGDVPRQRRALDPGARAVRQIGAEIGGAQRVDYGEARQLAQMLAEEVEQRAEVAPVSGNRMRRGAALARQPCDPQRDRSAQIVGRRETRERDRLGQHREGRRLFVGVVFRTAGRRRGPRRRLPHRPRSSHCAIVISTARARKLSNSVPRPG